MLCTTEQDHPVPVAPPARSQPVRTQPRTQAGRCHADSSLDYPQQDILFPGVNQVTRIWFQSLPSCHPEHGEHLARIRLSSALAHTDRFKKSPKSKTLSIVPRQFASFLSMPAFKPIHLIRAHKCNPSYQCSACEPRNTHPRSPHCFI